MKRTIVTVALVFPIVVSAAGFDRDLFFGLRSDGDVMRMQEFLHDQGLYQGPQNGNFFNLTKAAVIRFQTNEKISPAVGFFGAKTRARANELLGKASASAGTSSELSREALAAKIKELEAKLRALVEKQTKEAATSSPPIMPAPSAPVFIKAPYIFSQGFVADSPFGVHYPYRVKFDWTADKENTTDTVSCSPVIKINGNTGRSAEYYPESNTTYSCIVTVKDASGGSIDATVGFTAPSWVNVTGKNTSTFPDIEQTLMKVGEFQVFNGGMTDILFANFETLFTDALASTPNRGNKIYVNLRDGKDNTSNLVSQTTFTFNTPHPLANNPFILPVSLPFDVRLKPGEEKTISIWIEQMKFVTSGTFKIESTKINTTGAQEIHGGFSVILTKAPPL